MKWAVTWYDDTTIIMDSHDVGTYGWTVDKNGELKIEDFNIAVTSYNEAKIFKLRAETELKQAKYSLEEIVGVKLEDIL